MDNTVGISNGTHHNQCSRKTDHYCKTATAQEIAVAAQECYVIIKITISACL